MRRRYDVTFEFSQELETQRNGMMTRIAELESQISLHVAGIQREKVQDNVEYIRMWRQVKQANDKLISVQATNDTLHGQIGDLKKLLEETTKYVVPETKGISARMTLFQISETTEK